MFSEDGEVVVVEEDGTHVLIWFHLLLGVKKFLEPHLVYFRFKRVIKDRVKNSLT